ncbi:hypothetical protein CRP_126 [Candidatus Carsonella ruddii PV]|uniref:Uncharacterized protein n=1 Tax=Carsonella ruddii (strain PV) TaxID=387662 RepID=Q05FL4_CARRP|nr:hypothetical protein [Candidatus Carsonella ruddii]BAF35157.1 hypothetical protein CRP_126 [Candidatus Carsonella ruddii PV]
MKIKLIYLFKNKNYTSNFFNYLIQINLKIIFLKIFFFSNIFHKKIIFINDKYYKINQFIKSSKKCFNINKIYFCKNYNFIYFNKLKFFKKFKFYKNFTFIFKKKKYLIFSSFKKKLYLSSILNNFLFL